VYGILLKCRGVIVHQGCHLGGLDGSTDHPRIYDFSFFSCKLYLWNSVTAAQTICCI